MKLSSIANLLISVMFLAAGAGAQEFSFDNGGSLKDILKQTAGIDIPTAPSSGETDARSVKDWTIMVFMNGKNNLSSYAVKDMNEMEVFGPTANINIVTEIGRATIPSYPSYPGAYEPYYTNNGGTAPHPGWPSSQNPHLPTMYKVPAGDTKSANWEGVRRYEIVKDADTYELGSTLIETLSNADMGDYNHLVDFVLWAKGRYPAKRYMLIVWNHGDGWRTKSRGTTPSTKGISYDDETHNGITTVQLGLALKKMGGVDIYASDACLMQMSEVIYELKDSAPVIVGSEETEPGDGWAYDLFLERVHKNQNNLTPEVVASAAVESYGQYYNGKGMGTTLSAVTTRNLEGFRALVDQWTVIAMAKGEKDLLKQALKEAKEYSGVDSRDFTHFLTLTASTTRIPELKAKSEEVINFIASKIVFKNATSGEAYKTSAGLGIYLPAYGYDANYAKLAWSTNGQWDEFAQWINKK